MKKILFGIVLLAAGWWYFIGGRTLSEEDVRTFYAEQERVGLQRDPKGLCALLASDYESTGTVSVGGRTSPEVKQNREQACAAYVGMYEQFEKMGAKRGGIMQLDSSYTIHDISLAANKKSATVDITSALDVGGTVMNIRSRATETLIRRNGKTLLLRSESKGSISSGG